jgi:hypothetical protein
MQTNSVNWEKVSGSLANHSKRWWGIGIGLQFIVVGINIVIVLVVGSFSQSLSLLAALLSIGYVFTQWYSDRLKRVSDSVKRKFEMYDGLGWKLTPKEVSDLIVAVPEKIINDAKIPSDEPFFDSDAPPSPQRVIQNLEESSWWTKHLADSMTKVTALVCAGIFAIASVTMVIALQTITNQTVVVILSKIIVSIIVFIFSGGYFRMSFEYFRLSKEAEKIEDRASKILSTRKITETVALKELHEYQIARSGAPPIPTWIWSIRQKRLNQAWKLRRELEKA